MKNWALQAMRDAAARPKVKRATIPTHQIRSEAEEERQLLIELLHELMAYPSISEMFEELNRVMLEAELLVTQPEAGFYGELQLHPGQPITVLPQGVVLPSNLWQDDNDGWWSHCRPILGYEHKVTWGKPTVKWIKGDYKIGWGVYETSPNPENLIAFITTYLRVGESPAQLRVEICIPGFPTSEIQLPALLNRHLTRSSQSIKEALRQSVYYYFRRKK